MWPITVTNGLEAGAHEAFRLRFSVQPKLAVDAADDQIEAA